MGHERSNDKTDWVVRACWAVNRAAVVPGRREPGGELLDSTDGDPGDVRPRQVGKIAAWQTEIKAHSDSVTPLTVQPSL